MEQSSKSTRKLNLSFDILPARYVVDQQGIIRAADVNADYTIRPEPSETLKSLEALKRFLVDTETRTRLRRRE